MDPNGHFIICYIDTNSKLLTLANVYAPNEDDPDLFQAVFNHLSNFHCEEIIIETTNNTNGNFLIWF